MSKFECNVGLLCFSSDRHLLAQSAQGSIQHLCRLQTIIRHQFKQGDRKFQLQKSFKPLSIFHGASVSSLNTRPRPDTKSLMSCFLTLVNSMFVISGVNLSRCGLCWCEARPRLWSHSSGEIRGDYLPPNQGFLSHYYHQCEDQVGVSYNQPGASKLQSRPQSGSNLFSLKLKIEIIRGPDSDPLPLAGHCTTQSSSGGCHLLCHPCLLSSCHHLDHLLLTTD